MNRKDLIDDINYIPSKDEIEKSTKDFLKTNNVVELNKNVKITKK
ncbi:MAG: hypothetical protein Q8S84_04060 [bacterium]|nr:hypothetical protein [bacterium]MDP3380680.1 hypothetical protein [bacterium]